MYCDSVCVVVMFVIVVFVVHLTLAQRLPPLHQRPPGIPRYGQAPVNNPMQQRPQGELHYGQVNAPSNFRPQRPPGPRGDGRSPYDYDLVGSVSQGYRQEYDPSLFTGGANPEGGNDINNFKLLITC